MRHRVSGYKLGRTASHRVAMTRNMASSIIEHERITTTLIKAKAIRPFVEKLVTLAKVDSVHHRRRAFAQLRNKDAVIKLFETIGPRFAERPGGYTRILKLSKPRLGDASERAIIEFVERTIEVDTGSESETEEAAAE